jgi:hypothetical protein
VTAAAAMRAHPKGLRRLQNASGPTPEPPVAKSTKMQAAFSLTVLSRKKSDPLEGVRFRWSSHIVEPINQPFDYCHRPREGKGLFQSAWRKTMRAHSGLKAWPVNGLTVTMVDCTNSSLHPNQ